MVITQKCRGFVEESNASIKLSPLEQSLPGVNDRIVTITGTLDQQLRAAALIVTKLSEDPNYHQYASTSLAYTGRIGNLSVVILLCLSTASCLNIVYE